MPISDELLEILVCPVDKGSLLYVEGEQLLYNPRLHRKYAIVDDIPNMLIDESEVVDDAEHERIVALARP